MPITRPSLLFASLFALALAAPAQTMTAMSPSWAQAMCTAWNADETLTGALVESGWIRNDAGRGFKAMQIWRADCQASERVEMRIAMKDGKAVCVSAGAAGGQPLSPDADYQMWAQTPRWREMGAGEYGPMRAMMFGRLQFDGPKMEAMSNMVPFERFLLLVGKVPGEWGACP
jgi:putative sterol carrier protein